ncbi:hypothetical protein [Primorskyibacter flagellatus]|nr:hypothetical protein [Primorskyibacter flagellatus]
MRYSALSQSPGTARYPTALRVAVTTLRLPVAATRALIAARRRVRAPLSQTMSTEMLGDRLGLTVLVGHPDIKALAPHVRPSIRDWAAQDWVNLGQRLNRLDRHKATLPSGEAVASALGRALFRHIVGSRIAALIDRGTAIGPSELPEDPFAPLFRILTKPDTEPALHFLAAQFQLELGWARRGDDVTDFASEDALNSAQARFRVAGNMLDRIAPRAPHSPYYAEIDYRILAAEGTTEDELNRAAARWSRADPASVTPFAVHGQHLLPRWYGQEGSLEAFAERSWAKTQDVLGTAAYAASYISAIESEPEAQLDLDMEAFRDGLLDLMHISDDPDLTCNALLRMLWEASAVDFGLTGPEPAALRRSRQHLREIFVYLCRNTLGPVMPDVWGGSWTEAKILHAVAEAFEEEIRAGKRISIGLQGAVISDD